MRTFRVYNESDGLRYCEYDDIDYDELPELISNGCYWKTGAWYFWRIIGSGTRSPSNKVNVLIIDIDYDFDKRMMKTMTANTRTKSIVNSYKSLIKTDLRNRLLDELMNESL
jgi:hypothetical protein